MLSEGVRGWATLRELVRVAHPNQIRRDTPANVLQVRDDIAPDIGRGWIAVQQDDRVANATLDVRHRVAEDLLPLLGQDSAVSHAALLYAWKDRCHVTGLPVRGRRRTRAGRW
jgi:hypothetical protein